MRFLTQLGFATVVACGIAVGCGSDSEEETSHGHRAGEGGEGATSSGGSSTGGSATGGSAGEGGAPSGGTTSTGGRGGSPSGGSASGGAPGGMGPGGEGGEDAPGGAAGHGGSGGDGSGIALRFDGVDDYVPLPVASGGANEAAYSVELWFRTSTATGMLFEVYGSGADRSLYLSAGKVCFYVYAPAYNEICTTAATYADGAWHHAAGTLGSGGQHLYVDGVAGPSTAVTASAFAADTGFRIGYGHIGPNGPLTYFAGDIDEVRVYSVERSMAEIASNRSMSIDASTAGLQGYWKLDESGSATSAPDSTNGDNHGTLTNFSFASSPWVTPGAF